MGISKKALKFNRYKLSGSLKKSGISLRRFVFAAAENTTGVEKIFFVEYEMLNPYLSPDLAVLGFKTRVAIKSEDLQNVLAGTVSARHLQSESIVIPSYCVVRAGVLGAKAKQLCSYYPVGVVESSNSVFEEKMGSCVFNENKISGQLEVSVSDIHEHPEFLCDSGFIKWNLQYEVKKDFTDGYSDKIFSWYATGAKTVFAGTVSMDGVEYTVSPKRSFGYIDISWGKGVPVDYVHLSSSNLTSIISGRTLSDACFVMQGSYEGRASIMVFLEQLELILSADTSKRSYSCQWECSQTPEDEQGEKLHWSASFHNKKFVVDVDVFCPASELFVRSLELPEGGRKTLKILTVGNGDGELRLYKKVGKNLELIEHVHIANCLSEFGQQEDFQK